MKSFYEKLTNGNPSIILNLFYILRALCTVTESILKLMQTYGFLILS